MQITLEVLGRWSLREPLRFQILQVLWVAVRVVDFRWWFENTFTSSHLVEKMDCAGHVQKRMGTALRNLKMQYRGQKLADGKTIGGAGRLTDRVINSLQNYYGDAIRRNKGKSRQWWRQFKQPCFTATLPTLSLDIIFAPNDLVPGANGKQRKRMAKCMITNILCPMPSSN